MKKRTLSILLALLLLALPSCSEKNPENTETADENPTAAAEVEAEAEEDVDDKTKYAPELPERDYDGFKFRIVSRNDDMHSYPVHTRDLKVEEMTGESVNDSVFERNALIEDTYNIEVVLETYSETANETTPNTMVQNSVMADTDDYDLLATHMINGANTALKKVLLNFGSLPYVDFGKPYWNQGAYQAFCVGDKTFLALSDMCFSSNDNTHCMVYNKKLAGDYQVGDLYESVKANEWTFDKFRTLVAGVSNDVNGDGKMTADDVYGYLIGGTSGLINWMFAGGSHVVAKDKNNLPYLDFYNEHTVELYDYTYEIYQSDDSYTISSWVDRAVPEMFGADHALIMSTQIGVIEDLRDMESDFGVLPYPKYNAEQENYAHYVDGHATIMAIPKTCRDLERQGILMEAFAYESYKSVLPWYYEVLMTKKNVRDEESGLMLELIYNTRAFDFAYVYDNFGMSFCFSYQVTANNPSLSSYYAKNEKVASKLIEKNVKTYAESE